MFFYDKNLPGMNGHVIKNPISEEPFNMAIHIFYEGKFITSAITICLEKTKSRAVFNGLKFQWRSGNYESEQNH